MLEFCIILLIYTYLERIESKLMIKIKEYTGHIRNWESLCHELSIDLNLTREQREQQILIKAYNKWQYKMGEHLHGMFAFALWDESENKLFCMRDQFGTKPFYYYVTDDSQIIYSSSIKKITENEKFVKKLNTEMLQHYLTFTYTPGENTFFQGIKKLLPGRYLIWQDGKLEIHRYWKPEFHPDNSRTLDQWADEIHSTLQTIMKEIKTPDETVSSFLSSGVDSSYVLAMSDAKKSISCGYNHSHLDESHLAKKTAEILHRESIVHIITPEEYFESIPYVMRHMELPLGDASSPAFALSCKAASQLTKICYSGEGADEFFAGYNIHRNAEKYGDDLVNFYIGNTNIMKEDEKKLLLKHYNPNILPINLVEEIYKDTKDFSPLSKMLCTDIQIWLEGDIYLNVDKMSQACGLEIRMPLTDTRIFDIASRIPDQYKIDDLHNKVALRTAALKVLPEDIVFRKKMGFVVPIRAWLSDSRYNSDVIKRFHGESAKEFFNIEQIDAIFDEYINGNSDNWRKVWTIYTFLVWYEEFYLQC